MKSTKNVDPASVLYSLSSSEMIRSITESADPIEVSEVVYRELEQNPVQKVDVIAEIQKNLKLINERQSRAHFLMRELAYLLKA
jgi:hypothetical protein